MLSANKYNINGNDTNINQNEKFSVIKLLTEKEFSIITRQKLSTIRSNRIKGVGCNFYKIGGSVRYKLSEVLEYIESCKCSSTTR